MSERELLEVEVEQSLEEVAADLETLAGVLADAGDELTVEFGGESTTVPAPSGDVEFEVEVESEEEDDGVEYEIELEIEWTRMEEGDGDDDLTVE